MLTTADAKKIAVDVTSVPPWFCSNWLTARVAINAIVKQVGNPVVGIVWRIVRGVLNQVYDATCRK